MRIAIYRRALGPRFSDLAPALQRLHDVTTATTWVGQSDVMRGSGLLVRLIAALAGLPESGKAQPLRVTFTPEGEGDRASERWERRFSERLFRTRQWSRGDHIVEAAGLVRFVFRPVVADGSLALELEGYRVLGLPLPRFLHPRVRTREHEAEGRYRFEVEAGLPLIGLLVRYEGWLEPEAARPTR